MAFMHGKETVFYLNGYDLTQDFNQTDVNCNDEASDVSTLGYDNKRYVDGMHDGQFSAQGFHNPASGRNYGVCRAALDASTNAIGNLFLQGDVAGYLGFGFEAIATQLNTPTSISQAGVLSFNAQANDGVSELARVYRAKASFAGATGGATGASTAVDNAAASTNGGEAFLQFFGATTGFGSLSGSFRHSANGSTWSSLAAFENITSTTPQAQRVKVTGAIDRHTQFVWNHTADSTADTATFHASFNRNP